MAVEDESENGGQSLVAYLESERNAKPKPRPYKRREVAVELRPYEPPPPPGIEERPVVDEPCSQLTRAGTPCQRDGVRDYDGVLLCASHAHLAPRNGGPLRAIHVDHEIEQRIKRDALHNPPSLHLILQRVRGMIDADQHGDRAALRESLLDIASAATHAAREMV